MRTAEEWNEVGRKGWEKFHGQSNTELISDLLMSLTGREFAVVTELFGIDNDEPGEVVKLAAEHGVTEERMIHILEKAFRKLSARNIEPIIEFL